MTLPSFNTLIERQAQRAERGALDTDKAQALFSNADVGFSL